MYVCREGTLTEGSAAGLICGIDYVLRTFCIAHVQLLYDSSLVVKAQMLCKQTQVVLSSPKPARNCHPCAHMTAWNRCVHAKSHHRIRCTSFKAICMILLQPTIATRYTVLCTKLSLAWHRMQAALSFGVYADCDSHAPCVLTPEDLVW